MLKDKFDFKHEQPHVRWTLLIFLFVFLWGFRKNRVIKRGLCEMTKLINEGFAALHSHFLSPNFTSPRF